MLRRPPRLLGGTALVAVLALAAVAAMLQLDPAAARSDSAGPVEPASGPVAARPEARMTPLSVGLSYGDELTWMESADLADALDDAAALGGWVRLDVSWANVQPDGPDSWDWSRLDPVIEGARARGLRVIAILGYTPEWARVPGCGTDKCRPASPSAFSAFVSAAVARYRPLGVRTWEVWNEPNSAAFWQPSPSAGDYAELLAGAVGEIRAIDRRARVLSGGLAAVPSADGHVSAPDFLRGLGERGALDLVDGVAYHPYTYPLLASDAPDDFPTAWNGIARTPDGLRGILRAYGRPRLPLWITEYGAPTGGPGTASDGAPGSTDASTTHVTEARQAEIARDSVSAAAADPGIRALIWYSGRDRGTSRESAENFYGLRRAAGAPKPAFVALREAVALEPRVRRPGR